MPDFWKPNPWFEDPLAWRVFDDGMMFDWLRQQARLVEAMEYAWRRQMAASRSFLQQHAFCLGN